MNILFLTLLDFEDLSEQGIYTDLLKQFVQHGHHISIISPVEKRKNSDTVLLNYRDYQILKLKIGNMQKINIIEKGISTLTIESKFTAAIKSYFSTIKFDLVIYSTPPITLQKAVAYVKQRDQAKSYLLLKDIFPQNAVDLQMLSKTGAKSLIYKYFRQKEKLLYETSDYIGCMSQANVDFVKKHNEQLASKIIEICPNSIAPLTIEKDKSTIYEMYNIPTNRMLCIYGGNLGKPQGIDFLMECLVANKYNEAVHFIIVGSGTEYERLAEFLKVEQLSNVTLLPFLPKKEYEQLANSCDVGLLFLDYRFTIPNFPSRLLSYMQAGMPVLAATDCHTDIKNIIEDGQFGCWCYSQDVDGFNKGLSLLADENIRLQMGGNARLFLEQHYTAANSYEIIMKHFKEVR